MFVDIMEADNWSHRPLEIMGIKSTQHDETKTWKLNNEWSIMHGGLCTRDHFLNYSVASK